MEKRVKMSKSDRAKQFAPFDALRGLQEALRIKEYEHDRKEKGDISQEKLTEMTTILLEHTRNYILNVKYFYDGYIMEKIGIAKIDLALRTITFDNLKINFDDIVDISVKKS